MALAVISAKCRRDRAWKRCTEELRGAVIHSTGDLALVVEKAREQCDTQPEISQAHQS